MIKTFCLENGNIPRRIGKKMNHIIDTEILKELIVSKNKINSDKYKKYWDKTIQLCKHILSKKGRLGYIISGYKKVIK